MIVIKRKHLSFPSGYIFPTLENLSPGQYKSTLREIRNAEQKCSNGVNSSKELVGLDCFHELVDANGELIKVRFRYYADSGQVEELAQILEAYGYEGVIGDVKDVDETVILQPVGENSKYLYIAERDLEEVS